MIADQVCLAYPGSKFGVQMGVRVCGEFVSIFDKLVFQTGQSVLLRQQNGNELEFNCSFGAESP